jgi:SAM-dependent methyltransferase
MTGERRALREDITRLGPWHHDVEVAPGIRTGDPALAPASDPARGTPSVIRPSALLTPLVQELFGGSLAGRSFLDCACNAGGYVFGATALGSPRAYGFDVRRHWIDQAEFLARHLPSDGAAFGCHDLADLPGRGLEPFDVTLFSGIFYHLPDPVAGLRIAATLTREVLMVNTSTLPGSGDALMLNPESDTELMSGVHRLAWLPTGPRVMDAILGWCGFPYTRLVFDRPTTSGRRRIFILAARTPEIFAGTAFGATATRGGLAGWTKAAIGRLGGATRSWRRAHARMAAPPTSRPSSSPS